MPIMFCPLTDEIQLPKDSSNHRKIGDLNEALRICKQAAHTASVQLNTFTSNKEKSEVISKEKIHINVTWHVVFPMSRSIFVLNL